MTLLFSKYLIKYDDISDEIIIDTRTKEEYIKNKILKYNIPIIEKKEHDFLHKYLLIAELVIIYGMIKNIKNIKQQLIEISNNKQDKIVVACSKGRLRSPTMWIYAKALGIDAKVLKGGIVTIDSSTAYIDK
ncbi:MAG: rhodanese-like domain-containing protein [Peptostreptococcaceae bacterium]